jgi:hypothetical protein
MSRRFTEAEIIEAIRQVKSFEVNRSDSPVYQAWAELADSWMADSAGDYHWEGFVGFQDRSEEEIVEDFQINDLVREEGEPHLQPNNEDYTVQLNNNGILELDVEDGTIRYRDVDGNTENVYKPEDEGYSEMRTRFGDLPTLIDLERALQEAQDNFNTETGSKVQELIDTLPNFVNTDELRKEYAWVFEQVDR